MSQLIKVPPISIAPSLGDAQLAAKVAARVKANASHVVRAAQGVRTVAPRALSGLPTKLSLALTEMFCQEKTGELREGDDEVNIAGVAFDAKLNAVPVGPTRVTTFARTGDRKTFSPAIELATLDFAAGVPAVYGALLVSIEDDGHKAGETIAAVFAAEIEALKAELLGAQASTPVGKAASSFLETLANVASTLGTLVEVFKEISPFFGLLQKVDEVFSPATIKLGVDSATDPFGNGAPSSSPQTLSWQNKGPLRFGEYQGTLTWIART